MKDTELINKINELTSDEEIEKFIRKCFPNVIDENTVFYMKGFVKGAAHIRKLIIGLLNQESGIR